MEKLPWRLPVIVVAVASLVTAGCTSVEEPSPQAAADVPVTFSNIAETKSLDPHKAFSSESVLFVRQVYDSLLEYEPGTGNVRAALATEWTPSADAKSLTLKLRQGVTFHDGSALDSAVVKTSMDRLLGVNQGPATLMTNIESVQAPAPDTIVFQLKAPDALFAGILPKLPIVSAKAIETNKTAADPWAGSWFDDNEAGSGPYKLGQWDKGKAITLTANKDYWRSFEPGTPTSVTLRTDPDVTTAVQLMCQGKVDMIGGIGTDQTDQARACSGVKAVEQSKVGLNTVFFNQKATGPVSDVRVRKAIALVVDYAAYQAYFKGKASMPRGPIPPAAVDFQPPLPEPTRDVARAKQLLAEAGYPNGGFELTYLGLKGLAWEEFFGTLLEQNLQEVGIKLKQTLVGWPQMVSMQSNPKTAADLSYYIMNLTTPNPLSILSNYASRSWASAGGGNWGYYSNPQVDAALDRLTSIIDEGQRVAALREVQQQIVDDQAAIWLPTSNIYQPVLETWDVKYEPVDFVVMVRFFFARKQTS